MVFWHYWLSILPPTFPPVLALLYYFLFAVLVESVPMSHPPPAFREAAERAKTLVEKILRDLPAVHAAAIDTEVNNTCDWLAQLHSCPSFVSNLFLSSSGFEPGPVASDPKPAVDGDLTGHPRRPHPQTTVWTLHKGQSEGSSGSHGEQVLEVVFHYYRVSLVYDSFDQSHIPSLSHRCSQGATSSVLNSTRVKLQRNFMNSHKWGK